MALSVKVLFQTTKKHGGGQGITTDEEESRRFSIEQDVASNYEYFRAKVAKIMPSLENKAFRLYWKDDEDDLVAFSSDEELIEALGHVPDNSDCTFRVYVRELDDSTQTPPISSRVSSGCRGGISFPPLQMLLAAHQGACGQRPRGRGATCSNGHAAAAQPETRGTSSSTENQRRTSVNAESAAAGDANEKMDEAEAGCSKNGQPTSGRGDGEERLTRDFITNMFSGIGSLLTSLGVQNNQSQTPGDNSRDEQSYNKQTNDVTGGGATATNGNDGQHSTSETSSDQTASGLSDDGLIQVVETLKEMGFNDDDGSLSRLVATHSGQIERIIQFIQTCRATC